ncbi:2-dehydropantoate 2-reductase [Hypericibacter sp.]|uniref:2-dehydropantoate 2-reductase n=1 Tax=Hypericibacter sp. TaxID=2705401 RepID=UPI003D6CE7FC
MRWLILGAGSVGGYFGGRLQEAGADVTFLVRPGRAQLLREQGLVIESPDGAARLQPKLLPTGAAAGQPFDAVLLTCKAYDLDAAIAAVAPHLGSATAILPLLNGLLHLDRLEAAFGFERVLGGVCHISATLGPAGEIRHLDLPPRLVFGERAGGGSDRVRAIAADLAPAKFKSVPSEDILQEMWEKFTMLATLAGLTCLMRGNVGEIARAGGAGIARAMLNETSAVAAAAGHGPRDKFLEATAQRLTDPASTVQASMLRDLERGGPTEGAHILGDMVARGGNLSVPTPLIEAAACHVAVYEARRGARKEA